MFVLSRGGSTLRTRLPSPIVVTVMTTVMVVVLLLLLQRCVTAVAQTASVNYDFRPIFALSVVVVVGERVRPGCVLRRRGRFLSFLRLD